jgi:hypothetical protein
MKSDNMAKDNAIIETVLVVYVAMCSLSRLFLLFRMNLMPTSKNELVGCL